MAFWFRWESFDWSFVSLVGWMKGSPPFLLGGGSRRGTLRDDYSNAKMCCIDLRLQSRKITFCLQSSDVMACTMCLKSRQ
jgi:hypothetical protein